MNKKLKNLIILPVLLLVGMFMTIDVNAADGFKVTRSITGVTNTVTNTFTYTVTAVAGNPGTAVTPPAAATIQFTSSNTVSGNAVTKSQDVFPESVWSALNYTAPGDYFFEVTEATGNGAYPSLGSSKYVVQIYVTNHLTGGVPDGGYEAAYVGSRLNGSGDKIIKTASVNITTAAQMSSLTVKNVTKGSAANTNEYFKYTVTINNTIGGQNYVMSIPDTGSITWDDGTVTPSSSCTTGSCVIYLKHNQTATIGVSGTYSQLPVGITYGVTQNNTSSQTTNYTTQYRIGGPSATAVTGTSFTNQTINATASNNAIIFENTNNGSGVPSSLFVKLFPFLVLLVLSGVGLYTVNKNKKIEAAE